MKWAYGITTVPERLKNGLFPKTLASLAQAGFDKPRLFVDDCENPRLYDCFGLEVTSHWPRIRTYGNWILALAELFIRNPSMDRYAIFQDDFVTVRGLKDYIEKCKFPETGYFNLYTFPKNQELAPASTGWYLSNQLGYGAVALVFNHAGVVKLLSQQVLVERPMDVHRGHKAVDGAIVTAFRKLDWKEYVHNPSLVQHTGLESSMGNKKHPLAISFPGENFDALSLLTTESHTDIPFTLWEVEMQALEKARADDIERKNNAPTLRERMKLKMHIEDYDKRIQKHQLLRH